MQAPTIIRTAEHQTRLGQSFGGGPSYGQPTTSKATFHRGTVLRRFEARKIGGSLTRTEVKQRVDRKVGSGFVMLVVCAADAPETRPQSKHQPHWISTKNIWKRASDRVPVISENVLDALEKIKLPMQNGREESFAEVSDDKVVQSFVRWSGAMLGAIAVSLTVLTSPGPSLTDSSFAFSNSARADQLGQLKQAGTVLERAAEGVSKFRFDGDKGLLQVVEKAVTVVTGANLVDTAAINKEVESIVHGEKDIKEELTNGISDVVQNSWSTVLDLWTNFNPGALSETAGANISVFFEASAERIAAFELSALVSFAERWAILTPLFVIPMAFEMKRLKVKSEREAKAGEGKSDELNRQAQLKGEKVRRELERIELRKLLLDAVGSLGKTALQPPRTTAEAGMIRRSINDMLERLEGLKPVEDPSLLIPEVASAVSVSEAGKTDALATVPASPTVDGLWRLIYVSEARNGGFEQRFPDFPGFGLDNISQRVWQAASLGVLTADENDRPLPSPLQARNTAEIRLGPLGVFQVAVQGSWEHLKNGQTALVSFDTFSARPVEILGNKVSDDIPELNFLLPSALQRSAEWAIAYVDNHVRVNRGSQGQLFVFNRVE